MRIIVVLIAIFAIMSLASAEMRSPNCALEGSFNSGSAVMSSKDGTTMTGVMGAPVYETVPDEPVELTEAEMAKVTGVPFPVLGPSARDSMAMCCLMRNSYIPRLVPIRPIVPANTLVIITIRFN